MLPHATDPSIDKPAEPPQSSHETRAPPQGQEKRAKRPKTRRNNTKAVEKEFEKKRRQKKQAARLRNATKTDGFAEDDDEGVGQLSDSDFQHNLPVADVKRELLIQLCSLLQC